MRAAWLLVALPCFTQTLTQRGFLDLRFIGYPRDAPNDSGNAVGDGWLRYEASVKASPALRFLGMVDARTDTHRQVEREWRLDVSDRTFLRPAFSLRRAGVQFNKGGLTLEAGKQFIRWGKADVLTPTDRFAPRDFINVVDNDFLGILAVRATWERGGNTLDLVWQPRFTPSRLPLLNQRWAPLPEQAEGIPVQEASPRFPGGSQFGVRFTRTGAVDYGLSFFDGFNHLPLFDARLSTFPLSVRLQRYFAQMRMYGGDVAWPLRWFTVKAEAAYFGSKTVTADEYVQYVIQLERQSGEWSFVGGYAGEAVTTQRSTLTFAPDRGLTKTLLGRASYTIDARRSFAMEFAVRQNGDGSWLRGEYTHLLSKHWRATAGIIWIRGTPEDFLGQYYRNSHAIVSLRYSF